MDRVNRTISKWHSLHKQFAIAFSATMLIPDEGDKKQVTEYLEEMKTTFETRESHIQNGFGKELRDIFLKKILFIKL